MVDFQSRDTRRGFGGGDEDEEEDDEGTEAEESAGEDETAEPASDEPTVADEGDELTGAETAATESGGDDETATASESETVSGDTSTDAATPTADSGERADPSDTDRPAAAQSGPVGSKSAPPQQKPSAATEATSVNAAVVTVGTAGEDSDPTGEAVVAALESAGHAITARERLRGDFDGVQQSVDALVGRDDVDVVVTAGGTGIRADEIAIEAVHPLLEKALPGFGEAFRTLLFDHIGTGIVAVRTTAGVAESTLVFCLPGDQAAAALGVEEIVAAEAGELVDHLRSE